MRWRTRSLASLHWRCWEAQWVVFNVGSGQTHLLDEVTAAVLSTIESSPGDADALSALELQDATLGERILPSDTLKSVLEQLVGAGLIEAAAS